MSLMLNSLFDKSIEELKGIGPYYQKKLKALRIKTIRDFLRHFPSRYEDFSQLKKISELEADGVCSVFAKIEKIKTRKSFKKRLFITEAVLKDETGEVPVTWFGQPFLMKSLKAGVLVIVSGKVVSKEDKISFQSPVFEIVSRDQEEFESAEIHFEKLKHTAGLIPVYPETRGMTSRGIRFFIKPVIEIAKNQSDFLPRSVVEKAGLLDFENAIQQVHFPSSLEMAEKARKRFAFEEIFLTQFLLLEARAENASFKAPSVAIDIEFVKNILEKLNFELTQTQKNALWEIIKNLNKNYPMNRLLNGDVGSGKTIVVLIALALVVKSGYQAVFMAPTEILSRQHFKTASKILKEFSAKGGSASGGGIEIALLVSKQAMIVSTGLEGELTKLSLKKIISSGKPILVVGTQAVLQKDIDFPKLGLVVVDEQHRFGVKQRQQLLLGESLVPHFLSMSATPIPRTLALGLWGDLDISIISELPKDRKRIETSLVDSSGRQWLYGFIRERVGLGEQVFIICPRIEQADFDYQKFLTSDAKSVKQEFEKLKTEVFKDLKLGILHGRLKPSEKERVMNDFFENKISILVSTSVIEVGIDVPNATIMVVEGADRFGLAQLHQFRGRVGRGEKQSFCFLLSETESKIAQERLKAFSDSYDGFSLAEEDLKLRGPGQFFGVKQSGIPDMATNALKDLKLVILARKLAEACLLKFDKLPLLKSELESFRQRVHLE
ncbi:MAG: ATP-dependent DNA helicase RecG [Candidatus Brennerbacteria bacterium RIFOXYC1_FULL_41_11]|uniref:Probable DNA 3'-5' helicase RecG n=1 Tax=Candidatus Brennerbacteria bacterium RIFOXYD1_FULL_41_16 TaxID=1797529 RepID=A0A1G1XLN7_9BACT|nr:MAG: ATP-dependent DNA helicase RecG [Candidatus Brennerbacteria bacterium RIFOXYB1_FULL_41_13]OGY38920.1 MAG: ATP-dependent DNA helicase RecG [Candidatus Brennerbacteria bacterium RIFOXYC1_FULL_41_11]OGY40596.1 MAG: ATP-dependent DNA helicase RecG [Candidatus Brennerbacteria bacterium RIFOXYD1_FULL_41_16]